MSYQHFPWKSLKVLTFPEQFKLNLKVLTLGESAPGPKVYVKNIRLEWGCNVKTFRVN